MFGLISYAFTGGKRDFVSRQQLQSRRGTTSSASSRCSATRKKILGLGGGWPPTDGTATAPTQSALEQAADTLAEKADEVADALPKPDGGVPPATA